MVNNKISYTPKTAYSGTETLTYTVKDSKDAQVQGKISVTIKAKPKAKKTSGGSVPLITLLLLPLLIVRQKWLGM